MKKDGIDSNTVKKFNELVTSKLNRVGYIFRPNGESASKFLTSGNYLSDKLVERHISNEQTIGGKIADIEGESFTSLLMFDLDAPEVQTDYFVNTICKEILQVEGPSYSFINEKNGHEYHYVYLDKTIPYNYIRTLSTLTRTDLKTQGIKPIDIKPDRAGVRLMFGGSYNMVDTYSRIPIAPQDHQAEIEIAYDLFESGNITLASTGTVRENLNNVLHQQKSIELDHEVITPSNNFYVDGELWKEVEKLETIGLSAPSTRNEAQMKIVYACVHRGLTEQQTIGYIIQQWLPKYHNGQSNDYKKAEATYTPKNDSFKHIRAEIRSAYRWAVKTYKPELAKRGPGPLTQEERQDLYRYTIELTRPDRLKPKQLNKVYELICHIYQLYKHVGSNNIVAISHSLFDRWGYSQRKTYKTKTGEMRALFCAVAYLKKNNAIRPMYRRSYSKVCQRYYLQFLKTTPRIFKSIPLLEKRERKGIELEDSIEGSTLSVPIKKGKALAPNENLSRNGGKTTARREFDKQTDNKGNVWRYLLDQYHKRE